MLDLRVFAGPRPGGRAAALHRRHRPPAGAARAVGLRAVVPDRPAERDAARRGGGDREDVPRRRRARCRRPRRRCTSCPAAPSAAARSTSLRARGSSTPRGLPTWPTSTRTSARPTSRCTTRRWLPERSSATPPAARSPSRRSSGGEGAAGFTVEPLAQFDFTAPGTAPFYARLVREAVDQGKDGFMEDFGEYTRPDARSADGTPPARSTTAIRATTTARSSASRAASAARSSASSAPGGRAPRAAP